LTQLAGGFVDGKVACFHERKQISKTFFVHARSLALLPEVFPVTSVRMGVWRSSATTLRASFALLATAFHASSFCVSFWLVPRPTACVVCSR
jgi:hypothetical protein